jgi:hypothetical protein
MGTRTYFVMQHLRRLGLLKPASKESSVHLMQTHGQFYTASDDGVQKLLADTLFLEELSVVFAPKCDTRYLQPAAQGLSEVCFIPVPGSNSTWPDNFQLLLGATGGDPMEWVLFGAMNKSCTPAPGTKRYRSSQHSLLATVDANDAATGHLQNPSEAMCVMPLRTAPKWPRSIEVTSAQGQPISFKRSSEVPEDPLSQKPYSTSLRPVAIKPTNPISLLRKSILLALPY